MGVWLDDEFPEHPKVEALDDDLARWLYVAGLCYANRNLTGGRIPKGAALRLTDKASRKLIDKLLATPVPGHGPLWEDHGDHYRIHNYAPKQQSAEKRRAEKQQEKERRSEHARRAAEARWAAELAASGEHQSSTNRASPEHPPGIDRADPGAADEQGEFLAPPPPRASAAGRATPAQPNALVPPGRSSSSHQGAGDPPAEEEEELSVVDQALVAIAAAKLDRCLSDPEHKPINDRAGWLQAVIAKDRMAFGAQMSTMVAGGASVELLVRTFDRQPAAPPSPYPLAGQQPAPTYDEVFEDGEWKLVEHGVSA